MANAKLETKSNKTGRIVETTTPDVLTSAVSLDSIISALGEDLAKAKIQAQLKVDFRSQIRTKLESKDDNEDFRYSDDDITSVDYSDWVPELRTRKSPEEKAADALGKLANDPDAVKAALAKAGITL